MNARQRQNEHPEMNGVFCTVQELFFEGLKAKNAFLDRAHKRAPIGASGMRSRIRGRGMEFFESRLYVPQDEMRTIDWKVSARFSKLFTKVFIEERDRPTYIAVDLRPSMFFGSRRCFKSVLAAHIAARLSIAAIKSGDQVSGLVFDQHKEHHTALCHSDKKLARWFSLLADGTKSLKNHRVIENMLKWPQVLLSLANRIRPGAEIFLLSDFLDLDDNAKGVLFKLKRKASVYACALFDPLEEEMPPLGRVGMVFGNERVLFDSSDRSFMKKYETHWRNQQEKTIHLFRSMGIPYARFSTAHEPDHELRRIFLGQW